MRREINIVTSLGGVCFPLSRFSLVLIPDSNVFKKKNSSAEYIDDVYSHTSCHIWRILERVI